MTDTINKFSLKASTVSMSTLLVLVVLVPFCFIVAAIGWYSIQLLESHTRFRMQEDIELIARAIKLPISYAMERNQNEIVERALESAFSIDRVYGIFVYDKDGNTVYTNGAKVAEMENARIQEFAHSKNYLGEFYVTDDETVYSFYLPLINPQGELTGVLHVTRRGQDFDKFMGTVRNKALAVILITIVTISLTIILGFRWLVGRHLRYIEKGLRLIKTKEIKHRVIVRGPLEIRLLVSNINEMLDAVQKSQDEIALHNKREAVLKDQLYQFEKLATIGRLAAGVAHELGSPLSVVDGIAQRILRRKDLSTEIDSNIKNIRSQSSRMEQTIRHLLDFGRTNPLHLTPITASQPLISTLKLVQKESLPDRAVKIQIDQQAKLITINVDSLRIEHALLNLLRNAFREAKSTVIVSCYIANDSVYYTVEDDGPGVDEKNFPQLFEPFFTTKPTGQGTGLGLAVAHAAVSDHGGELFVDTSRKPYSRFCISLPLNLKK